jgi:hypothetical protein
MTFEAYIYPSSTYACSRAYRPFRHPRTGALKQLAMICVISLPLFDDVVALSPSTNLGRNGRFDPWNRRVETSAHYLWEPRHLICFARSNEVEFQNDKQTERSMEGNIDTCKVFVEASIERCYIRMQSKFRWHALRLAVIVRKGSI